LHFRHICSVAGKTADEVTAPVITFQIAGVRALVVPTTRANHLFDDASSEKLAINSPSKLGRS
jgi:hypothetical protein